jgi:hypothetical protein
VHYHLYFKHLLIDDDLIVVLLPDFVLYDIKVKEIEEYASVDEMEECSWCDL